MKKVKVAIALMLAIALNTNAVHAMQSSSTSSAWDAVKAGCIALLVATAPAEALGAMGAQLPQCELNQARVAHAAQLAHQTGECVNFCEFPYLNAYAFPGGCSVPDEYYLAACPSAELKKTLPEELMRQASQKRQSSIDFFIAKAKDWINGIRRLWYAGNPNTPACSPFNETNYNQTAEVAAKTGKCQQYCIEPGQDCNRDGGGGLIARRLYAHALCPEEAFDDFPEDCQDAIANLEEDETTAMGFLFNEFKDAPKDTQFLECPKNKHSKKKARTRRRRRRG